MRRVGALWSTGLLALLLVGQVHAQDPCGVWFPSGGVQPRYVWVLDGRVHFEQRWEGVGELRLEGGPVEGGWRLEGTCRDRTLSLELQAAGEGWHATLRDARGWVVRERWYRPAPGWIELSGLRLTPAGLRLQVIVRGRPLRVTLRITSSDPRWDELGGLVHHDRVGPLPVGAHELSWDLRERGWREERVPSGDYAVEVGPSESEGLSRPGDEGAPAVVVRVVRLVLDAPPDPP